MSKDNSDRSVINEYCLAMIVIVIISSLGVWLRAVTFNTISEKIAQFLRYDLFMHLITKDVGFFDEHKTGDILSRMASDITVVQSGLGTNISMFTRSLVLVIVTISILVFISWELTLVTLSGIIPIILFAIVFAINIRKLTKEQQARNAECGNVSEEAISNMRTVKAFACEQHEI